MKEKKIPLSKLSIADLLSICYYDVMRKQHNYMGYGSMTELITDKQMLCARIELEKRLKNIDFHY